MKKMLILTALLASTVAIAPASAKPITYTFNGIFTGTLDGQAFTTSAVFTGKGDTSNTSNGFGFDGILGVPFSSFAAVAGGVTYNILDQGFFYLYNPPAYGAQSTRLGFGFGTSGTNAFGLESPAYNGYDGLSTFANTPGVAYYQTSQFNTDLGFVSISAVTDGSFSAVAVPEPATWGMMILGFGLIGGAMRRAVRRTTSVTFDTKSKTAAA